MQKCIVCIQDAVICVTEFKEVRRVLNLLRWMNSTTSNVTWKKHVNRYFRTFEFENVTNTVPQFKIENTNQRYNHFFLNFHMCIHIFAVSNLKML